MSKGKGMIDKANEEAVKRILPSQAILVDVRPAIRAIPGMKKDTILHAGPPIEWEKMCGPMKGAIMGAIIFEGLAKTPEEAKRLAETGEVQVEDANHDHQTVGPMSGVTSPSMQVYVVENKVHGNFAYTCVRPGDINWGCYDDKAIEHLHWVEKTLGPVLAAAVKGTGGFDLKSVLARGLQMGDECHSRFTASTSIFVREMMPHIISTGFDKDVLSSIVKYFAGPERDLFFLTLMMPACKAMMDPAKGIRNSSVVTAMARNGVQFGMKVSGLGDQWITSPSSMPSGVFWPPFTKNDANPDLGDSAISETRGLGGTAIAASPVLARGARGITFKNALDHTKQMAEISVAEDDKFIIPTLEFAGTPVGIDIRKVVETGIVPIIDTGIAHKDPGHRLIGTGYAEAPIECFKKALFAFAEKYSK